MSGRGVLSAAAAAAAILGTLDAGLAAGHGHTIADRHGYADLLLEGQRAAGAAAVGGAGDAGAALARHRGRPHDGGGVQGQGRGNIHALGSHFIAAGGRAGLLRRTRLERRMLINFIDAQRSSLISLNRICHILRRPPRRRANWLWSNVWSPYSCGNPIRRLPDTPHPMPPGLHVPPGLCEKLFAPLSQLCYNFVKKRPGPPQSGPRTEKRNLWTKNRNKNSIR